MQQHAFFTEPVIVFGILFIILALIFKTSASNSPFFKKLYKFLPHLILCYFIPSLLVNFNIISDLDGNLYYVASRFLLPACIVLLTLSVDLKSILELGPKVIIMFLTATLGVIIGGPIALIIIIKFFPNIIPEIGLDSLWRGMSTIAGTWIGGGANQTAMREVFEVPDAIFSIMVTVDILTAGIWIAVMLWIAGNAKKVDEFLKADTSALDDLKEKLEHFQQENQKIPTSINLITICGIAFGIVAVSYYLGMLIIPEISKHAPELKHLGLTSQFFWTIILSTTFSLILSFKKKVRQLESYGASKLGTVFLYILIATIGMSMELRAIFENFTLFLIGFIWMSVHAIILFGMAKAIKAPSFYACVGSTANIGGAASAPVIASAFHPSLAPVGVLLAMFGYALGTYGAWLCGQIMRLITL